MFVFKGRFGEIHRLLTYVVSARHGKIVSDGRVFRLNEREEKPMDLLHETVRHRRFGSGTITSFDGRVLVVSFDGAGERSFSYPSAFGAFLTADNEAVQAEAERAIRAKEAEDATNTARVQQDIDALRAEAKKKPAAKRAPRKPAPLPSKAKI